VSSTELTAVTCQQYCGKLVSPTAWTQNIGDQHYLRLNLLSLRHIGFHAMDTMQTSAQTAEQCQLPAQLAHDNIVPADLQSSKLVNAINTDMNVGCDAVLLDLPPPCLLRVLELMTPQALAAFSCCCQTTVQLCSYEALWRTVLKSNYGGSWDWRLLTSCGGPQHSVLWQ
jgi:hypothetical protein